MPSIALPTASIARVLLLNPWFAALDADTRNDLVAAAEPVHLPRGGVVFRQGELSTGFYGLVHGALCVSTVSETGREAVLTVLEPGHWFGEASALDGLPRSHDVVARSDARLLRVGRDDFNRLMLRSGFARAIALLQAHYLRTVFAMLEDATLRSTRGRIARRLQRLALGDASRHPEDRCVLRITQDMLAMMIGITRQTLALELKALAQAGAIRIGYRRIEILSMTQLDELAACPGPTNGPGLLRPAAAPCPGASPGG